jgi:hypothetical protein
MYYPEFNQGKKMAPQSKVEIGSREWLMKFQEDTFKNIMEMTKRKNNDYAGKGGDAFNNFSRVENLCPVITTEMGFFVRLTDKFSRISSFIQNGELLVKDESAEDTLLDLSNYAFLFYAYLKAKKLKEDAKKCNDVQEEPRQLEKNYIARSIQNDIDNLPKNQTELEYLRSQVKYLVNRNAMLEESSSILGREVSNLDKKLAKANLDSRSSVSEGGCSEDYSQVKNGLEHN